MTLLSYDNTFEGFLTAIFEIYEYKYALPQINKSINNQQNLFSDAIEIITDEQKSDRVIKKLEAQMVDLQANLDEIRTHEKETRTLLGKAEKSK